MGQIKNDFARMKWKVLASAVANIKANTKSVRSVNENVADFPSYKVIFEFIKPQSQVLKGFSNRFSVLLQYLVVMPGTRFNPTMQRAPFPLR
jgi:hypothetical protein